ncbi:hypothetical protein ASPBRDRAFT_37900 [Aspergillus brasiliensis CBS 101740]|uniref:Lysozyme n=1 Tax=Aspergillus brasiliensis (strain CBS 101740 / IMI 381727 / IBT 21946) TaxID=767769 RepID=A0A1L9UV96_ASPBC|nr:hypothetical protein ASPBRDRAFT_37900 [Aspergillus brasiliensis CBS 101740]
MSEQIPRLSPAARARLKEREGLRTTAYRDAGGSQAIGYGINQRSYPEEFASIVSSPTKENSDLAFDMVVDKLERGVARYPNINKLNRNQVDAVIIYVLCAET